MLLNVSNILHIHILQVPYRKKKAVFFSSCSWNDKKRPVNIEEHLPFTAIRIFPQELEEMKPKPRNKWYFLILLIMEPKKQ